VKPSNAVRKNFSVTFDGAYDDLTSLRH